MTFGIQLVLHVDTCATDRALIGLSVKVNIPDTSLTDSWRSELIPWFLGERRDGGLGVQGVQGC